MGQGDATLIRSPTGQVALIDAGPAHSADSPGIGDHLRRLAVDRIDLLVASHNHADHIGGVPEVLGIVPVRFFMDNGIPHTTLTYRRMLEAMLEADVPLLEPERRTIDLGAVVLEILPPPGDEALGHNDNSVGVVLRYGDFRATFAGDAEETLWGYWLRTTPEALEPVHVHKASHHGSRNGDIPEAIERLRPEWVVVSAGRGNRYGHPHAEALALYRSVGARVVTTARAGSITVRVAPDAEFAVEGVNAGAVREEALDSGGLGSGCGEGGLPWTLVAFPDYHCLSQGFTRFTERIER